MHLKLKRPDDLRGWLLAVRDALSKGYPPETLTFTTQSEETPDLFASAPIAGDAPRRRAEPAGTEAARSPAAGRAGEVSGSEHGGEGGLPETVSARAPASQLSPPQLAKTLTTTPGFLSLAKATVCHRDPRRFGYLLRLLIKVQDRPDVTDNPADPDVYALRRLAQAVWRDSHKMTAFVRFRKTGEGAEGREQFVAWFEPSHYTLRYTAPFFRRRFANMDWSILTPDECAHWHDGQLTFSAGVSKDSAPAGDELEDYWRSYYASIFNPARLKPAMMASEMPKKYWKNLPEADLIPELVRQAAAREQEMLSAGPSVPRLSLKAHGISQE